MYVKVKLVLITKALAQIPILDQGYLQNTTSMHSHITFSELFINTTLSVFSYHLSNCLNPDKRNVNFMFT